MHSNKSGEITLVNSGYLLEGNRTDFSLKTRRKNDEDESDLEKNAKMISSSIVLRIKYRDTDIIYGYLFATLWPLKEAGVDS